jgi:PilZ domain
MSTHQVHERRPAQRFDVQLPITVRPVGSQQEFCGYTQNVSMRGAFFYSDVSLSAGDQAELKLRMPAEITLTEAMPVRCKVKVVRVVPPAGGTTYGVAVQLQSYEFLPEPDGAAKVREALDRVSPVDETGEDYSPGIYGRRTALP